MSGTFCGLARTEQTKARRQYRRAARRTEAIRNIVRTVGKLRESADWNEAHGNPSEAEALRADVLQLVSLAELYATVVPMYQQEARKHAANARRYASWAAESAAA